MAGVVEVAPQTAVEISVAAQNAAGGVAGRKTAVPVVEQIVEVVAVAGNIDAMPCFCTVGSAVHNHFARNSAAEYSKWSAGDQLDLVVARKDLVVVDMNLVVEHLLAGVLGYLHLSQY